MSSRGQKIRDYLREQGRPCAPGEIAAAIGLPALPVCHTIGNLFRSGMLGRTGAGRAFHYFLIREATPRGPRKTAEEKRARKAARERQRSDRVRRARGAMTAEEYAAKRAESRQQRLAAVEQQRHEREELKIAQKAEQRASDSARVVVRTQRKLTPAQRVLAHEPAIPTVKLDAAPKPLAPKVETVAEWMARTGKRPEVLPASWNQARAA